MKSIQNAAGQPAGAGTLHAATLQITALIAAGEVAVELFRAEQIIKVAKARYHAKIDQFEAKHGRVDSRIDPRKPEHAKVIKYTKAEFEAYLDAKRKACNVRRRLENASRKAVSQISAGAQA